MISLRKCGAKAHRLRTSGIIHDVHPLTDINIEVFYADRTLETFGSVGWFWWPRRRGFLPDGPTTGPFATSYAAYRHALHSAQGSRQRTFFGAGCNKDWPENVRRGSGEDFSNTSPSSANR